MSACSVRREVRALTAVMQLYRMPEAEGWWSRTMMLWRSFSLSDVGISLLAASLFLTWKAEPYITLGDKIVWSMSQKQLVRGILYQETPLEHWLAVLAKISNVLSKLWYPAEVIFFFLGGGGCYKSVQQQPVNDQSSAHLPHNMGHGNPISYASHGLHLPDKLWQAACRE